jgi:hypothetical protein
MFSLSMEYAIEDCNHAAKVAGCTHSVVIMRGIVGDYMYMVVQGNSPDAVYVTTVVAFQ